MMYRQGELDAFRAGFNLSAESYNAEYGGPSDEWLELHYRRWRSNRAIDLGPTCLAPSFQRSSPSCSRPQGHAGAHSWEHRGALRYAAVSEPRR